MVGLLILWNAIEKIVLNISPKAAKVVITRQSQVKKKLSNSARTKVSKDGLNYPNGLRIGIS